VTQLCHKLTQLCQNRCKSTKAQSNLFVAPKLGARWICFRLISSPSCNRCVCVCIHTYLHAYICMYTYICTCIHFVWYPAPLATGVYVCVYTYVSTCIHCVRLISRHATDDGEEDACPSCNRYLYECMCVSVCVYVCIRMYIYTYMHVCVCVCVRERERERERERMQQALYEGHEEFALRRALESMDTRAY
jgi:hypothetical protein